MIVNHKKLVCSVGALAVLALLPLSAHAETVVTQTYVKTKETENIRNIDFSEFDLNEDGSYSMEEVGEKMFYIFDTDGNQVIDNIEWNNVNFYTITPMQAESFKYVDRDGDGNFVLKDHSYDTFYVQSGLAKFDKDGTGLSAAKFIGAGFEELDSDDDKMITLREWQRVYLDSRPKHDRPENYQR